MAENDQNDEYKFVELDGLDNPMMDDPDSKQSSGTSSFERPVGSSKKDIKRNAILALGLIILAMVLYKIIGSFIHKKDEVAVQQPVQPTSQIAAVQPTQTIQPITQPTTQPVVNSAPSYNPQPVNTVDNSELTKKVNAIEMAQQNVRSEVGTVSQQVNSVNSNVQNLNNQIASLNQVINNLSTQLAKQTEEINVLMVRTQPKRVIKHISKPMTSPLVYYIQAVIPGRAWIIGTNGSTLTVREGTKIAGYGVVKLIDPLEGRVVTSSGQVIRFSQEDS
ncbi:type IVB secretion system protein IcmG/DotF [Legionella sp. km772]|uniref:type IVB secretion system protein IcmG/DotF n=1 Tax=Legionella sp. km772 TaxID=2498111 RepID=UPI000F8E6A79|nr:type IVB secretion system protein IcmG/DotF [Legionella sp. km772]RUR12244.1 type IV secretion protein IcmG [Legionella sp. km772]